ncbi:hypothetical protein D3C77_624220 [compost metagenome]
MAIADLPAPDKPVNHSNTGCWPICSARAFLFTSTCCIWMFCERRREKSIRPAPTVALVRRSMRMKLPVSRLLL